MAMTTQALRLRTAAWFGWQMESSWADPVLFVVYEVAKPLALALILAVMYRAASGATVHTPMFAALYLANAFHAYVNTVAVGMGWAIFEERELFETLKYIVASPLGLPTYLVGRSVVKFTFASVSVLLSLALGWFALGVRWDWAHVPVPALLATLALGAVAVLGAGLLLAGLALVLNRAAMTVLEGVTLGLYLLCGVIFPIDLLPRVLQWVSLALPFTWWYEALRRFLLGHGSSTLLAGWSDAQLLGTLAAVTLVFAIAALVGFRAFETAARRLGRIDQTTMF